MSKSNKITSQSLAKIAAKVLSSNKYSAISKRLAGSVLSQYPGNKHKKRLRTSSIRLP